jgi:ryanodine receptor 2
MKETRREYIPEPVDVSDVSLESPLMELSEVLAKNVHDTWSARRISEGWRYGEKRDDDKKLHPELVPYSELPESEKEYDRLTAMNTLRLIVKLGYTISLKEEK